MPFFFVCFLDTEIVVGERVAPPLARRLWGMVPIDARLDNMNEEQSSAVE